MRKTSRRNLSVPMALLAGGSRAGEHWSGMEAMVAQDTAWGPWGMLGRGPKDRKAGQEPRPTKDTLAASELQGKARIGV